MDYRGNPRNGVFEVAKREQFKYFRFALNSKFNFACKYVRGESFEVIYHGVRSDIRLYSVSGFVYNEEEYKTDVSLEMNTLHYLGYDTHYKRLELAYSYWSRSEMIIFTDTGIRYNNYATGVWKEVESMEKGITLSTLRRELLFG